MPVTTAQAAPYAPTSTVVDVIARYRDRGLPTPVSKDVLARAGVPETLIPRVLQTLQVLDLIDENGQPTPVFEGIRRAPEAELNQRKQEWLNSAYADALHYVDPNTADETQVRDAFRNYNPVGQQARMVSLFMGLYADAGIGQERASAPRTRSPATPRATSAPRAATRTGLTFAKALQQKTGRPLQHGTDLPEPLMGMLTRLPANGTGWTQQERDKFMSTFGTVLDFCFPIVSADTPAQQEQEGE
jgi:hypothetical protein